jgi:DeoR family transcriptional regulator, fructose operon transcriptional repressor
MVSNRMNYKERYTQIAEIIRNKKRVLVSELAGYFDVSEVTIRKDLTHLEEIGICRRFHSGAVAATETGIVDVPVKHKITIEKVLKQRIARLAVGIVKPKSTILIDAGSTAHLIACFLKGSKNLRVVTNSLMVGSELADETGIEVVLTGGNVRPVSQALVGSIALEIIKKIHVDIAFVGAMGVSLERGFTSPTLAEAQVKEAMVSSARMKVIVADHTKLEQVSFAKFAGFADIDLLITDSEADPQIVEKYRQAGLEVKLAAE